jgi:hypothetical protein
MSGVMLLGAIKTIDATQIDVTPCLEWTRKDCIKQAQQPLCPEIERKSPCALNAAAQTEQPFNKENSNE